MLVRNSSVKGPQARKPKNNCKETYTVSKDGEQSILEYYINNLDSKSLNDQNQMPNPNFMVNE